MKTTKGLGRSSPLLAATLTIFLLSLIGIPMTGGFFAKFYVFSAALRANLIWLTLIGVVNSAIGAYYYLRIIVVMYMRESRKEVPVNPISFGFGAALVVSYSRHTLSGTSARPEYSQITQRSARRFSPQAAVSSATQVPSAPAFSALNSLVEKRKSAFDKHAYAACIMCQPSSTFQFFPSQELTSGSEESTQCPN